MTGGGGVVLSGAKYLFFKKLFCSFLSFCCEAVLFISFFLLRPKRKKRNQRKKKRCQNEIRNFSSETLKVAMLLRVSTKKLRFRSRLRDFYRGYRIYRVELAWRVKRFLPVTLSVSEESFWCGRVEDSSASPQRQTVCRMTGGV